MFAFQEQLHKIILSQSILSLDFYQKGNRTTKFYFQNSHVQVNKYLKSIKHCTNEKTGIRRVGKIELKNEDKQNAIFLPSSC